VPPAESSSLGESPNADVATPEAESPLPPTAWDEHKRMAQERIDQVFSPQTLPTAQTDPLEEELEDRTENLPPQGTEVRRSRFLQGAPERIKEIWERPQSAEPPHPTISTKKPSVQGPEKRRRRTKKEMEAGRENEKKALAKKKTLMAIWRENDGRRRGSMSCEAEVEAEAEAEEGGHGPWETDPAPQDTGEGTFLRS
jgi:hypothetical protein